MSPPIPRRGCIPAEPASVLPSKDVITPAEAYLEGWTITEPKLVSAGHIAPILTAKLPNRSRGCDRPLS